MIIVICKNSWLWDIPKLRDKRHVACYLDFIARLIDGAAILPTKENFACGSGETYGRHHVGISAVRIFSCISGNSAAALALIISHSVLCIVHIIRIQLNIRVHNSIEVICSIGIANLRCPSDPFVIFRYGDDIGIIALFKDIPQVVFYSRHSCRINCTAVGQRCILWRTTAAHPHIVRSVHNRRRPFGIDHKVVRGHDFRGKVERHGKSIILIPALEFIFIRKYAGFWRYITRKTR